MKLTVVGNGEDARNIAYGLRCDRFRLNADLAIRYGNIRTVSKVSGKPFHYTRELNSIQAINNARNKFKTLYILISNDIPVPNYVIATNVSENTISEGIWFGRKKFHTQGSDIVICNNHQEILNNCRTSDYYIKYIPIRKEYRIHVFHDKIIQACIKYKETGNDGHGESEDMIRNLEHGWKFSELEQCNHNVKDLAIKAVKVLGLDFGAVDIIKGMDGKYYVLEVNTAPGLDNKRLNAYLEVFKSYIEELERPNVRMAAKVKYPEWFINKRTICFEQGRTDIDNCCVEFIKEYLSHVNH
jgi:glutathione synthase/RimK-type ligase-like ATP-grasp enzyme